MLPFASHLSQAPASSSGGTNVRMAPASVKPQSHLGSADQLLESTALDSSTFPSALQCTMSWEKKEESPGASTQSNSQKVSLRVPWTVCAQDMNRDTTWVMFRDADVSAGRFAAIIISAWFGGCFFFFPLVKMCNSRCSFSPQSLQHYKCWRG